MTGYEPLNTPKKVSENIWVVDGPAIRFYGTPFSTRMTIVQLNNGDIWLHSPTKLTDTLATAVSALGPVRHLIAPNWIHYAYISEWQSAFPKASAYAAPGIIERAAKRGIAMHFDEMLEQGTRTVWADDIKQMIVEGSRVHREAVFFHTISRTLILTDLIENFESKNLSWPLRVLTRLAGIQDPNGQMPRDMRLTFFRQKEKLKAAVEQMIEWNPERIILAHGRWYNQNAVDELQRSFHWLL